MVVDLLACIIPGNVILKVMVMGLIPYMVVGLIAGIIPGNVRLRAMYENSSVSYMDSQFGTYHIGSIIWQRVS